MIRKMCNIHRKNSVLKSALKPKMKGSTALSLVLIELEFYRERSSTLKDSSHLQKISVDHHQLVRRQHAFPLPILRRARNNFVNLRSMKKSWPSIYSYLISKLDRQRMLIILQITLSKYRFN